MGLVPRFFLRKVKDQWSIREISISYESFVNNKIASFTDTFRKYTYFDDRTLVHVH